MISHHWLIILNKSYKHLGWMNWWMDEWMDISKTWCAKITLQLSLLACVICVFSHLFLFKWTGESLSVYYAISFHFPFDPCSQWDQWMQGFLSNWPIYSFFRISLLLALTSSHLPELVLFFFIKALYRGSVLESLPSSTAICELISGEPSDERYN